MQLNSNQSQWQRAPGAALEFGISQATGEPNPTVREASYRRWKPWVHETMKKENSGVGRNRQFTLLSLSAAYLTNHGSNPPGPTLTKSGSFHPKDNKKNLVYQPTSVFWKISEKLLMHSSSYDSGQWFGIWFAWTSTWSPKLKRWLPCRATRPG